MAGLLDPCFLSCHACTACSRVCWSTSAPRSLMYVVLYLACGLALQCAAACSTAALQIFLVYQRLAGRSADRNPSCFGQQRPSACCCLKSPGCGLDWGFLHRLICLYRLNLCHDFDWFGLRTHEPDEGHVYTAQSAAPEVWLVMVHRSQEKHVRCVCKPTRFSDLAISVNVTPTTTEMQRSCPAI